jgi:hypothetical protein
VLCLWAGPAVQERVPAPRPSLPSLTLERNRRDEPRLEPLADGRYRYEDRDGGFVAYVRPDGSVEFETITRIERPRVQLPGGGGWFGGLGDALQRSAGERDRPELETPMPLREDASARAFANAQLVPWGPYGPPPILIGVGMGLPGLPGVRGGPSKKAQREFLRSTQGMRDAMAVQWRKDQLERATAQVGRRIVEIWTDDALSLTARKRLVFELWDEVETQGVEAEGPLEHATREAAAIARRRIEDTIRRLAPPGSNAAYTAAELERFNAQRQSPEPFAPYDRRQKTE